jgi:hypothetical protein
LVFGEFFLVGAFRFCGGSVAVLALKKEVFGSKLLPMTSIPVSASLRFLAAIALLGSIVWQIADRVANNLFRPEEYFSYFTIQSSLIAGAVMALSGWWALTDKPETPTMARVRMSVVTFAVVVALVYNLLLRDSAGSPLDAGYVWPVLPNELLHVWGPVLILLDWLFSKQSEAVRFRAAFWVWAFPFAWLAFSIIRGSITGWWPYWFIDPTGDGGIAGMLTYIFGIMAFLYVTAMLMLVARRATNR